MRGSAVLGLVFAASAVAAGAARAEPSVRIEHAVARVTVIPEARGDITVTVVKTNPRVPLKISRFADSIIVDGGLMLRSPNCHRILGIAGASVWGIGSIRWDDMPQVVVHTPMSAKVAASGAVYGNVGRGAGLELSNSGCGDWTVADQSGPVRLHLAGSGDVKAGAAGPADIGISGSGDVNLGAVHGGLTSSIAGAGDVIVASLDGPLHAHVAGSGDTRVHAGAVSDMDVAIVGSGDVSFGGVAQSLKVRVAGSGDVSVAKVTGSVTKAVAGSGDVRVGR